MRWLTTQGAHDATLASEPSRAPASSASASALASAAPPDPTRSAAPVETMTAPGSARRARWCGDESIIERKAKDEALDGTGPLPVQRAAKGTT